MNTLNFKAMSIGLLMVTASTLSFNASAAEKSTEAAVTEFVVAQGQHMMKELSSQLQKSIQQELSEFSLSETFTWFNEEQQSMLSQTATPKSNNKSSEE